MGEVVWV